MPPDPEHLVLDWQAVGFLLGVGLATLGGLRWYHTRMDDRMTAIETGQREFRERVIADYVRSPELSAAVASIRCDVRDWRAELKAELGDHRTRLDQDRALLQAQLSQIQDAMARLSGERRTRVTD